MEPVTLKEVTRHDRLRRAVAILLLTLAVSGAAFGYVYENDQVGFETLWLLPFLFLGLYLSYRYWTTLHVAVVTPEAQRQELAAQSEAQRRAREFDNKWYVRYPLAALML
jgi:hypothetical protein